MRLTILALIALGLAACGDRAANADPLADSEWRLVEFGHPGGLEPAAAEATIRFASDAGVDGWAGCNGFAGQYRVRGSELEFEGVRVSARGCPSAAIARQEQKMLTLLSQSTQFEIHGERLRLRSDGGQGLFEFARSADFSA